MKLPCPFGFKNCEYKILDIIIWITILFIILAIILLLGMGKGNVFEWW